MFIGVLFMESKKLFIKVEDTMIQHDPIRESGDFYQTNLLWKQLIDKKDGLKNILSEDNYKMLEKHIAHIGKVFDTVVSVFKKMYGNGEFYFTFAESQKYTDRKEFIDIFKNKVIFLSNTNKQASSITSNDTSPLIRGDAESRGISNTNTQGTPLIGGETKRGLLNEKAQSIKVIQPKVDVLVEYITNEIEKSPEEISYFIFSPKKDESKKIFEDLCQKGIHTKATLLVENIT